MSLDFEIFGDGDGDIPNDLDVSMAEAEANESADVAAENAASDSTDEAIDGDVVIPSLNDEGEFVDEPYLSPGDDPPFVLGDGEPEVDGIGASLPEIPDLDDAAGWTEIYGTPISHQEDPTDEIFAELDRAAEDDVDGIVESFESVGHDTEQTEIVGRDEWTEIVGGAEQAVGHDSEQTEIVGHDSEQTEIVGHDTEQTEIVGHTDDWTEILGNQAKDEMQLLGLDVTSRSPAFRQFAAQRVAQGMADLRGIPLEKARDWQVDFGPASAPAGEELTFTAAPQCIFRGEKVIATDTATPPGSGTRIKSILVGMKLQRPANQGATLTQFFGASALANGTTWDTSAPAITIAITVSFITACTFDLTVFGKGVV